MDLATFAAALGNLVISSEIEARRLLDQAAEVVQRRAQAEIGDYQPAAGPFAAWAPLTPATMQDRVNKGFSADDPLLRTGLMRDSIERTVINEHRAEVGSNNPYAIFQELGTATIPPRSFLGSAAVNSEQEVRDLIGSRFAAFLAGGGTRIGIR